jgi:cysteine-rich repeat protein
MRKGALTGCLILAGVAACIVGDDRSEMTTFGSAEESGTFGDGDGDGTEDGESGDVPECGDGVKEGGEQCDDGNQNPFDGCHECETSSCGDGIVDANEQCDDGNIDTQDACPDCNLAYCGDGYIQYGVEQCDDGNTDDTDDCIAPFCTMAICGDGSVWKDHEECDDGNDSDADVCPTSCTNAVCGDGFVYEGVEECDDQNMVEDDICANDCTSNGIFFKGDFVQNQAPAQQCNDWNTFRAQLQGFQFSRVAIWGSQDQTGVECEGVEADTVCQALASGGVANVFCDGRTWTVGECGGVELSASGQCQCSVGYTLRPCIGSTPWGGVNTDTCSPPSQTIEVVCQ